MKEFTAVIVNKIDFKTTKLYIHSTIIDDAALKDIS